MTWHEDARVEKIVEVLQSKNAVDLLLMDLRTISDAADYFILCNGTSDLHVKTLAEEVKERLRLDDCIPWHIEGLKTRRWVLIDYVDIVVHIFRRETREYYGLERLWGDAESTVFADTLENAMKTQSPDGDDFVFSTT